MNQTVSHPQPTLPTHHTAFTTDNYPILVAKMSLYYTHSNDLYYCTASCFYVSVSIKDVIIGFCRTLMLGAIPGLLCLISRSLFGLRTFVVCLLFAFLVPSVKKLICLMNLLMSKKHSFLIECFSLLVSIFYERDFTFCPCKNYFLDCQ